MNDIRPTGPGAPPRVSVVVRRGAWVLPRLGFMFVALLLVGVQPWAPASKAERSGARHALPASPGVDDARLTIEARRLLAEDEELSCLTLGVHVRAGVATVWGRVPSAELKQRALTAIKGLKGLADVRAEMTVVPKGELPLPPLADIPKRLPPAPATILSRQEEHRPVAGQPSSSMRGTGPIGLRPPTLPVQVDDVAPRAAPPGLRVSLSPPEVVPAARAEIQRDTPPTPPAAIPVDPAREVEAAVERVRLSEVRFRSISVQCREGTVYLLGSGPDHQALARLVAGVPGARGVVIVQEAPPRATEPGRER